MTARRIIKYASDKRHPPPVQSSRTDESQISKAVSVTDYNCRFCKESFDGSLKCESGQPICPKCRRPLRANKRIQFESAKCEDCKETFTQLSIKTYLPNGLPQCPNCKHKLQIPMSFKESNDSVTESRLETRRRFSTHICICKKCRCVIVMDKLPASNYLPDGRPFCGRCRTPLIDGEAYSTETHESHDEEKQDPEKQIKCPKCRSKYNIKEADEEGEISCRICRWRINCREKLDIKPVKADPNILTCKKCGFLSILNRLLASQFLPDGTPFCERCKTPLKETDFQISSRKPNNDYQNIQKIECVKCYQIYDISTLPESYFLPDGSPRCPMCKARHTFPPVVVEKHKEWKPLPRTIGRCRYCNKFIYLERITSTSYNEDGIPLCIRCSRPLLDEDFRPLYALVNIKSTEGRAFLEKCDMMDKMLQNSTEEMEAISPIENIYCSLDDGYVTCVRCCVMVEIKKAKRLKNGQPYCGNCKQPCFSVNDLPLTIQFLQNVNRFNILYREQFGIEKTRCALCHSDIDVLNLPLFCHLPNGEPTCINCNTHEPLETDITVAFSSENNETKANLGNMFTCTHCERTFALDKLDREHFTNTGMPKCLHCEMPCFTTTAQTNRKSDRRQSVWAPGKCLDTEENKHLEQIVHMREVLHDIAPYTRCPKCQHLLFHRSHPIDYFTEDGDLICTRCRNCIDADTIGVDKGFNCKTSERRQRGTSFTFYVRKYYNLWDRNIQARNPLKRFFKSLTNYGYPKNKRDAEYSVIHCYEPGMMGLKCPLAVNDEASEDANIVHSHNRLNHRGKHDDEFNENVWLKRMSNNKMYKDFKFEFGETAPFTKSKDFQLPPFKKREFIVEPINPTLHDRKILVLIDDSETAKIAFKWFVYNIMDSHRDIVVLLMMQESHQYRIRNLEPPLLRQFGQEETFEISISKFKKMSNRYTHILDDHGVEYIVLNSATCLPEETILNVAYNQNPDLLVVAYQPRNMKFPVYRTLHLYLRASLCTPVLFINNAEITVADIQNYMNMKKAKKKKQDFRRKSVRYSVMV